MGLLSLFSKQEETAQLVRIPSGSFTVDAQSRVLASTLPRSFPDKYIQEISIRILASFQNARNAGIPLNELAVNFKSFKITARELRGGAIVFLAPVIPK